MLNIINNENSWTRECLNKECLSNLVVIRYSKTIYPNEKKDVYFTKILGLIDDQDQLGWMIEIQLN